MFDIVTVPDEAGSDLEPLGTKPKFWFRDEAGNSCLFKEARPNTGEDWAEKITCELARLLALPHAEYDLAEWRGRAGVICQSFVPEDGHLEHGNELLAAVVPAYPQEQFYGVHYYTLDRVLDVLEQPHLQAPLHWPNNFDITKPVEVFMGYLMFDAWIANQDRHHENWGVITLPGSMTYLAPSFDHASSLGAIETECTRQDRLTTRDRNRSMAYYVRRARSAFYQSPNDRKTMASVEVFRRAMSRGAHAAQAWLTRLTEIDVARHVQPLFDNIPDARIAPHAAAFAMEMLELNRQRLLELYEEGA